MRTLNSLALCALLAGAVTFAVGCKTEQSSSATTAAVKPYPLTKCVVSGEAIEAGKEYTFVRDGQEIKLCCKDCLADFDKDPKKYMAKLSPAK